MTSPTKVEPDPGRVWLLRDFLTVDECTELIRRGEELGYQAAGVDGVSLDTVRNNDRVIHDNAAMATGFFQRAQPFLPTMIDGLALAGFHERFRFYRYDPGQAFSPHRDGIVERADVWEESRLTFMVYLNENVQGGETRFFAGTMAAFDKGPYLSVRPERGAALIFHHLIWHEGATVQSGRKYVLRTDVMFRGPPAPGV